VNQDQLQAIAELLLEDVIKKGEGDPYRYICANESLNKVLALIDEGEDAEYIRRCLEEL